MDGIDLCLYPAVAPPSGQTSNFTDPPTMAPALVGVTTLMLVAVTITTAMRITIYRKELRWSDYCCMVAYVGSLSQSVLIFPQMKYARHEWDVPVCWLLEESYSKILFSQGMLFVVGQIFAKLSVLLLFLDIFNVNKKTRIAIYMGMLATLLIYLPSIPVEASYFAPTPGQDWAEAFLNKSDRAVYWGIVQSILAIVLDMYLFSLPLPLLARLNMSSKKRRQVIAIFSTALLGLVANLLSLVFRALQYEHLHGDSLWYTAALLICTVVELNIAIIVSSLPGVAKFARVYGAKTSWPRLSTSLRHNKPSSTSRENIVENKGKTSSSAESNSAQAAPGYSSVTHVTQAIPFNDSDTHASFELQGNWKNATMLESLKRDHSAQV